MNTYLHTGKAGLTLSISVSLLIYEVPVKLCVCLCVYVEQQCAAPAERYHRTKKGGAGYKQIE